MLVKKQTWRDFYNPIRGLSMSRLVSMEDQAERGQFADLQWFYYHMERSDVTIMSAIARRLAFLDSLDWEIRMVDNADETLAQEQADLLRYAYDRLAKLLEMKNVSEFSIKGSNMTVAISTELQPLSILPRDPSTAQAIAETAGRVLVSGVGIVTAGQVMEKLSERPQVISQQVVRPEVVTIPASSGSVTTPATP